MIHLTIISTFRRRLKYGDFHKIKIGVENVILKKSQVWGKQEKPYIYDL